MEEEKKEKVRVIHVKILGGTQADVYEIGQSMKKFTKKLPYRLEAIITNDRVELRDVDFLLKELYHLKKQIEQDEVFTS